nr:hypothetical protein [Haloferula luteola]
MSTQLAHELEDEVLERAARQVSQLARRRFAVPVEVSANVVNVWIAVLVLLARWFRDQMLAAMSAAQNPLEKHLVAIALPHLRVSRWELHSSGENLVGCFPELLIDERLVPRGILRAIMNDHSAIQSVAHHARHILSNPPLAAGGFR